MDRHVATVGKAHQLQEAAGGRHGGEARLDIQIIKALARLRMGIAGRIGIAASRREDVAEGPHDLLMIRRGALLPGAIREELLGGQPVQPSDGGMDVVWAPEHAAGADHLGPHDRAHVAEILAVCKHPIHRQDEEAPDLLGDILAGLP